MPIFSRGGREGAGPLPGATVTPALTDAALTERGAYVRPYGLVIQAGGSRAWSSVFHPFDRLVLRRGDLGAMGLV
ncbi:hypothetical protein GCM10010448_18120 [Streptomyces glomeratus]|uniref:Uncharacterized protein n=1 Tax=Streptomyces glomeratus TaxID=284452 RepID=A0ABP6LBI7_9ACTN